MNDVVTKEVTIVGGELAPEHPELHHYTGRAGLEGIAAENVIRATHFSDLNDSTEVMHLKSRLRPELVASLRAILTRRRRRSALLDRELGRYGGIVKCANELAADLLSSFYRSAFLENNDDPLSDTAGTAYIASFCTHTHEPYERENGLLSQWRGYGGEDGFCLVFDTQDLGRMLGAEFNSFAYTHLNLSPAIYADASLMVATRFPALLEACELIVDSILSGTPAVGDGFEQFFAAATLVKHEAFKDEREVRVVGIPITERMRAMILPERPSVEIAPRRPELVASNSKRFIELFQGSGRPLPIKRVIVGPSRNQAASVAFADRVSGGRFAVVPSATPFKG